MYKIKFNKYLNKHSIFYTVDKPKLSWHFESDL